MMESGSGRSGRDTERVGHAFERPIKEVVQDHHRAMVDGEPSEAALELVPIDDAARPVGLDRLIGRQQAQMRGPIVLAATLCIAGAHEETI